MDEARGRGIHQRNYGGYQGRGVNRDNNMRNQGNETGHQNRNGYNGGYGNHNPRNFNRGHQSSMRQGRNQSQNRHLNWGPPNLPRTPDYGDRYGSSTSLNSEGDQSRHQNRSQHRRHERNHMGFQKLLSLFEMEPNKLIVILASENIGLNHLYKSELSNDFIVLIIRVLSQLCKSNFQENKAAILANACQKDFLDKLTLYICGLCLHDSKDKFRNKYFWDARDRFWNDLLNVFETVLQIIPSTGCEFLPKIIKQMCISINNLEVEQTVTVSENIRERIEDLQHKVMISIDERDRKEVKVKAELESEEPPDNFRELKLYPMVSEITNRNRAFIRPNIIMGSYKSVEHYLDIQFRLLREDFVAPLRTAICDFLQQITNNDNKRINNVRIYQNVKFIKKHTIQDKVTQIIQLPIQKKKLKLENTRRFMFGSLMCFTSDNFRTIIFGTIASRDPELLQKGQIAVEVLDNVKNKDSYTMIECSVYFEPYYHVLKALQIMTEDKFPLKRYIIDVAPDIYPPAYLTQFTKIKLENFEFSPLQLVNWPSCEQLNLDPSQYLAFQAALMKEFCVIQGPPGTGKTFIGLKVAQVLLENHKIWYIHQCPILVICFTNHALDQFLEGMLNFTKDIVRIGGQSKSEIMKKHNIREMRMKTSRSRKVNTLLTTQRHDLNRCLNEIKNHQKYLDCIRLGDSIIQFVNFVIIDEKIKNSWFENAPNSHLIEWLFGGTTIQERQQVRTRGLLQNRTEHKIIENDDNESDEEYYEQDFHEEERLVDDREDIVEKTYHFNEDNFLLTSLKVYEEKRKMIEEDLLYLKTKGLEVHKFSGYDELVAKEDEYNICLFDWYYLEKRLKEFQSGNFPPRPASINYENPASLTPDERWGLYFYWLSCFQEKLNTDLTMMDANYRTLFRQYEEVKQIEDINLMQEMLVVGMTTTGAARYQTLLQTLKCPIVIVEEAAEVLESHVIVSLTEGCKHLILIGDHQQLRPTTADYHLSKNFNLNISLFERMLNNKLHSEQLKVQHRMRPEIVKLIVPAIYPKLENHYSVESYPCVQGVTKNLYFITHTKPEEAVVDSGSRMNVHEAKFLIKFARHLILQGYLPSEITILATYSGQMFCLWKERNNYSMLKDVRITVVDNFQGEENKIILLSLVRSNVENNVGFLKIENRICVALTRAKEGLYIMGNMDILEKSCSVWHEINSVLKDNNSIGPYLTLECQIHPYKQTRVSTAEDFQNITEGGCSLLCGKDLNCGHTCKSLCHVADREHTRYKCKEKCKKLLCELDHPCPDLCFQSCKDCTFPMDVILKCGHTQSLPCCMQNTSEYQCPTKVQVKLECGHDAVKPCYKDIKDVPCSHPCEIRLLCGHACIKKCHIYNDPDHLKTVCNKPCERIKTGCSLDKHKCMLQCHQQCQLCEVIIKKIIECGHGHDLPCHMDTIGFECKRRCKKTLPCGHACRENCNEPCGNCQIKVKKLIPCGHYANMKCHEIPECSKCENLCIRTLRCGHCCDKKCREKCQDRCRVLVDNPHQAACGHKFKVPCYLAQLHVPSTDALSFCTVPCDEILQCTHKCSGTCGSCAQGRVHESCGEKCDRPLICGHLCDIPCSDMCQPCDKRCTYRCVHSKCGKKCGEPCTICKEPCVRRCRHVQCTEICGRKCNVSACTEPCPKILRCKHPCIGFCSDPCPPVCRICDSEHETFEIFFGSEDDPDARFVYLQECHHSIESDAMENWLQQSDGKNDANKEIDVKRCPKCKNIITLTQRYSDYIKNAYKDINSVKKIWFGDKEKNELNRLKLQDKLKEVKNINYQVYNRSRYMKSILKDLELKLKIKINEKRNPIHKAFAAATETKINLIETLVNIFTKGKFMEQSYSFDICLKQFDNIMAFMHNLNINLSMQRAQNIENEINRFERLVQFSIIEVNPYFTHSVIKPKMKDLLDQIKTKLNSITPYLESDDKILKALLETLHKCVDVSMKITSEERKSIVSAMQAEGLGKGRWFKCPNGHYFVIGECGGAMEIGKCNECGAKIGGSQHTLLHTNQFAGEMDGASNPAWSNAANMDMRNYNLDMDF